MMPIQQAVGVADNLPGPNQRSLMIVSLPADESNSPMTVNEPEGPFGKRVLLTPLTYAPVGEVFA